MVIILGAVESISTEGSYVELGLVRRAGTTTTYATDKGGDFGFSQIIVGSYQNVA